MKEVVLLKGPEEEAEAVVEVDSEEVGVGVVEVGLELEEAEAIQWWEGVVEVVVIRLVVAVVAEVAIPQRARLIDCCLHYSWKFGSWQWSL